MVKEGLIHDYDLHANHETSAQNQTCIICGTSPMGFQWSDYSGEAMCRQCGCVYQLKWGNDKQTKEGKYPYCNVKDEYIPILKEYWEQTKKWVCHGMMMNGHKTKEEFNKWMKANHPELLPKEQ